MPKYDNTDFDKFNKELKYCQSNYFSNNFTNFTTLTKNNENIEKINNLFD